jgi:hypothetical protein
VRGRDNNIISESIDTKSELCSLRIFETAGLLFLRSNRVRHKCRGAGFSLLREPFGTSGAARRSRLGPKSRIIDASLKRRARLLITNSAIPRQTRSLIRYALEIKDPYLAQLVRRVEAGELTIDCLEEKDEG